MQRSRFVYAIIMAMVALMIIPAQTARANPGHTILFGDSIFANPTYEQLNDTFGKMNPYTGQGKPGRPSPQGCPQGAHTVATELTRITGKRTINYGCPGTSSASPSTRFSFQSQVDHAIRNGDVAGASNIIIMIGINDGVRHFYNPNSAIPKIQREVAIKIRDIKRANPRAHVATVAYPSFSADNGAICPVRINPLNKRTGAPFDNFTFKAIEESADYALYKAAVETGSQFYDLRSATRYNNMCAPNHIRWMAGTVETQNPHNFAGHLTHNGVTGVARLLANNVVK